jgi:hypothetical protein
MRIRMFHSLGGALFIAAIVAACGGGAPSSTASPSLLAALPAIQASVTSATGYPAQAIELLAGPAHLRLSISDAKLAGADQATREAGAADIVAAVEKAMASRPELAPIQEISIASSIRKRPLERHAILTSKMCCNFAKGPNQRFSHHIT